MRNDPRGHPIRRELARLIGLLVDAPDAIHIAEARGRGGTTFKVHVAQNDLGKVIGRHGRTAHALRTLLEVRGARDGRRYGLDIRGS